MSMKTVLPFVSKAAMLAGALMLIDTPAQALDNMSRPGASCLPYNEASPGSIFHHFTGGLYNSGTSTVSVTCPVQRDDPDSTAGVWVAVYVSNPAGKTTSCTYSSNDITNAVIDSQTVSTSSSGFQPLYFTQVTSSSGWGPHYITCSVPGKGTIQSYFVQES